MPVFANGASRGLAEDWKSPSEVEKRPQALKLGEDWKSPSEVEKRPQALKLVEFHSAVQKSQPNLNRISTQSLPLGRGSCGIIRGTRLPDYIQGAGQVDCW
jgi:hypothetical protein